MPKDYSYKPRDCFYKPKDCSYKPRDCFYNPKDCSYKPKDGLYKVRDCCTFMVFGANRTAIIKYAFPL